MKIVVEIGRLVLDGLPLSNRDGHTVGAAVERELARMLALGGLSPELCAGGAVPRFQAPRLRMPEKPVAMGNRIAVAVHSTLAPGGVSHE